MLCVHVWCMTVIQASMLRILQLHLASWLLSHDSGQSPKRCQKLHAMVPSYHREARCRSTMCVDCILNFAGVHCVCDN